MIRQGDKLRLSTEERGFLSTLADEPVDPQTVTDYNAWLEHSVRDFSDTDPEERLAKAVLLRMKIEA